MKTEKIELLKKICEYYNYDCLISNDNYNFNSKTTGSNYSIRGIDNALLSWLDALEECDEEREYYNMGALWKNDIEFIYNNCTR